MDSKDKEQVSSLLERRESSGRRRRDSDLAERGRQRSGRRQSTGIFEGNPEEQADYEMRRAERRAAREIARSRDSTRERERKRERSREYLYGKESSSLKRSPTESRQHTRPPTRDREEVVQASNQSSRPSSRDHAILGTRPTSRDEKGVSANILGARKFFDSWRTKSNLKEQSRAYPPLSGAAKNDTDGSIVVLRPDVPQRRGSLFGRLRCPALQT